MKNSSSGNYKNEADPDPPRRRTFADLLQSDGDEYPFSFNMANTSPVNSETTLSSSSTSFRSTTSLSPTYLSPSRDLSFSTSSSWSFDTTLELDSPARLIGSLVRKEGHIYSLATAGDLLYTGSKSKRIRVWKNQKEFSGFKSKSGFVKAIIIAGESIFSCHQDGNIRIWKESHKDPSFYKHLGTLPTFRAKFKSSFNPNNYVKIRKHHIGIWIKHTDAISCLALSEDKSLLYSASWDRTFKVWRISGSKCLESVNAHDDAVNSIVTASNGLVFTGSADGTVKVWWRKVEEKGTKHFLTQTLLKQECGNGFGR